MSVSRAILERVTSLVEHKGVVALGSGSVVAAASLWVSGRPGVAVYSGVATACVLGAGLMWLAWRRGLSEIGGVLLIFPVVFAFAFGIGGVGHPREYLGIRVSDGMYILAIAGLLSWVLGVALASRRLPGTRVTNIPVPSKPLVFSLCVVGAVACAITAVNLATGSVPLLAGDVNEARFSGRLGALSSLAAPATAGLQVCAIASMLFIVSPCRLTSRVLSGVAAAGALGVLSLTGSRAFVLLPVAAVVLCLIERWRPPASALVALGVGGLLLLGVVGQYRIERSADVKYREAALIQHGFGTSPVGVAWHSLQTGPRIAELVTRRVPRETPYQRGFFFIRDGAAMLPFESEPSDRWVTREIFRKPIESQGGTPPTIIGGFYIDFGVPGVLIGMVLCGWVLATCRKLFLRAQSLPTYVAYGYVAAFFCLSIYSYVSFKTSLVAVLAICAVISTITRFWPNLTAALMRSLSRAETSACI